jgi:hypothetical protein
MIPGKVKIKISTDELMFLKGYVYELIEENEATDHQKKLNVISLMPLFKRFSVALLFPKKENKFSIPVTEALAFIVLYKQSKIILPTSVKITVRQFVTIIDKSVI